MTEPDPSHPEPKSPTAGLTLDYRSALPEARPPLSQFAVLSAICAALSCPAVPLVMMLMGWTWRGIGADLTLALLSFLLIWGFVSGQLAWRETHARDAPLRGRIVAEIALTLNVLWAVLYLAGLGMVAWVARHGLG